MRKKRALSEQWQKVIGLEFELRFHYDDGKTNQDNFEMEKEVWRQLFSEESYGAWWADFFK